MDTIAGIDRMSSLFPGGGGYLDGSDCHQVPSQ